jgi:hypothetical protein
MDIRIVVQEGRRGSIFSLKWPQLVIFIWDSWRNMWPKIDGLKENHKKLIQCNFDNERLAEIISFSYNFFLKNHRL